jgi:acid phosphatase (class A)
VSHAKGVYKRARPYALDPRIHPALGRPRDDSYPSGHAAAGYFFAIVLADMVPEKAAELYERGEAFARNRVIGGVHYPSDVETGKMSAALIAEALFASPDFQKDLSAARVELRAALGLPEGPRRGP